MSARGSLRIAIDASAIPAQPAGAGVYTYELVRALAAEIERHRLFVFARPGVFAGLPNADVIEVDPPSRIARLAWEQLAMPGLLSRYRIDVLHSPHHHTPLGSWTPNICLRPHRVVTFHDATFLLLPQRYPALRRAYMTLVTRAAARVADAIVTPSRTARDDVVRTLGVDPGMVVAIPEAAGARFSPEDDPGERERVRRAYALPERYVLSVGSLEPGKNRGRLILAYARLRAEGIAAPLLIAGQPAWRHEAEAELVRGLGLERDVRFLGYVPDADLPALYRGAALLAFPSLYEGFGLPVLEAMACGTPVVTSDRSATAEIANDAALLVDPHDIDALASAIGRLLADEQLRDELRARGLARAGEFSWRRAAQETLSLYEVVASTD